MRRSIRAGESSCIFLIGIFAANLLATIFMLALSSVKSGFDGMSAKNWVSYVVIQLAFVSSVLIWAKVGHLDERRIARIRKPRDLRQLIFTPFIAIATILVFLPLANAWTSFLDVIGYKLSGLEMPEFSSVGSYFLSLLVMAILPALGEELLMRGNVFSGLSSRGVWFGILMSALFFSLMHANPVQTVHQFGIGISLALTLILTDSLWACVLVHFFNNFISLTLTAYLPQVDVLYVSLGYYNWLVGAISVVAGLFMLLLLFYILYRLGSKDGYKVVDGGIEYDEVTIYVPSEYTKKLGFLKGFFRFFKSLFTRSGWIRITNVLSRNNDVEYLGKTQRMGAVWIALALVILYWIISFVSAFLPNTLGAL